MPVVIVLYSLAGLLELVGLLLVLHGFQRTWAEFVEGERLHRAFARSSWAALRRSAVATGRWSRRVLHIKGKTKAVVGVGAVSAMGMTSRATGRVSFGPLPSIADDPQAFAEEVHRRLQRVHAAAQDAQEAVANERETRAESMSALDRRTEAAIAEVAGKSRSHAVGGLIEALWGWIFLLVGTLLGTITNIIATQQ